MMEVKTAKPESVSMKGEFFQAKLASYGIRLQKKIDILQVNLGRFCNLACTHCHVEAGPHQTRENMDEQTASAVVRAIGKLNVKTLDLTGGAPELNPHFKFLVMEAGKRNVHTIDRSNLTVFYESGQKALPEFLAGQGVEIIASLPCYSEKNVDRQRGRGVFETSIRALHRLNELGYGKSDTGLVLNLVYNPVGPYLPPPQEKLEREYKKVLWKEFGIVFNRLYTITNMAITRYEKYLKAHGQYENYQTLLIDNFNPAALGGLMCRNTLNVGWDGKLYDCDFNQMLAMNINGRADQTVPTIVDVTPGELGKHDILMGDHCFGCTAGFDSSCQGALT